MVALEHQRGACGQHLDDVWRDRPGVGQHAQLLGTIAEDKLCRLPRIVRDGIGVDFQVANAETCMAVETPHRDRSQLPCSRCGAVAGMEGPAETIGTGRRSADMVGMFMGNQDGVDRVRLDTQALQAVRHFTRTETTIDQHPRSAGFDKQRVTLATAAEGGKTDHGKRLPNGIDLLFICAYIVLINPIILPSN